MQFGILEQHAKSIRDPVEREIPIRFGAYGHRKTEGNGAIPPSQAQAMRLAVDHVDPQGSLRRNVGVVNL